MNMGKTVHIGLIVLTAILMFFPIANIEPDVYAGIMFGALVSAIMEVRFFTFGDLYLSIKSKFGWL